MPSTVACGAAWTRSTPRTANTTRPHPGAHVGRAAVVAYLKQAVMPMHHGTNIFIEFDERPHHATGMVKFLCVHANASVTTGDYADEYVRTATDGGSCAAPAAS